MRKFVTPAIVATTYFAFAQLGLILAFPGTNISPVWPPSGFALAMVLLLGGRVWPGILLGAFVANFHGFLVHEQLGGLPALAAALAIAAGNTAEAMIGGALLRRRFDAIKLLDRVDNVFQFAGMTVLACAVSGLVGSAVHCFAGLTPWPSFPDSFATWWLADTTGAWFVAPPILMFAVRRGLRWTRIKLIEIPAILIAIVLYFRFVFVPWESEPYAHSHEYLIMPLLLWVAFRLGRRATTMTVFIVCAVAIWLTVQGLGPYAGPSMSVSLLSLQIFVALVALTFMVLMGSLTERRNALSDLHVLSTMLEDLVSQRTEELEEANEAKNQFLGMAAHDLRSSLNGMMGFSDLLAMSLKESLDRRQAGMLANIRDSSRHMLGLVENLLDVSAIEAGRLDLDLQPTDITATVERSVTLNSLMAATKQITVRVDATAGLIVKLDERRFEQVINNLLTNAFKYSAPESVVDVRIRQIEGDVVLSVRDEGIGIKESDRAWLFRPFAKGRRTGTAGEPSTGLGLAIAKSIVDRHGGRMWVESAEGHGSTFFVSLPHYKTPDALRDRNMPASTLSSQ